MSDSEATVSLEKADRIKSLIDEISNLAQQDEKQDIMELELKCLLKRVKKS